MIGNEMHGDKSVNQEMKDADMIMENPLTVGEPLKGNRQGYYSSSVKRNFIIIYLYCDACRKKGHDVVVACSDCKESKDQTIRFVMLGPHDDAYGI